MCGWCLACCTGAVPNTVRESATPDSKENKPDSKETSLILKKTSLILKKTSLILKKTSRLTTRAVVFFGIFCAARCCVIVHRQSVN